MIVFIGGPELPAEWIAAGWERHETQASAPSGEAMFVEGHEGWVCIFNSLGMCHPRIDEEYSVETILSLLRH